MVEHVFLIYFSEIYISFIFYFHDGSCFSKFDFFLDFIIFFLFSFSNILKLNNMTFMLFAYLIFFVSLIHINTHRHKSIFHLYTYNNNKIKNADVHVRERR